MLGAVRMVGGLVVIMLLTAGCTSTTSGAPATRKGVRVTCAWAGRPAQDDRAVLLARAAKLGKGATVTGTATRIVVVIPGATPAAARKLCSSSVITYRPLVAPTVVAHRAGSTGSLTGLGFPVPSNAADFAALSVAQQARLSAALATAGCPAGYRNGTVVVCQPSSPAQVALLGSPVISSHEVAGASAVAPSSAGGPQWAVRIRLTAAGQRVWAAYTGAHNTGGRTLAGGATTCGAATTPCADYVGFVVDGQLLSLPVTLAAINGPTQVTGNFTERSATALASALGSGTLPVPLTLTSVTPTH
jgi:preprotein translocase subunit SecD